MGKINVEGYAKKEYAFDTMNITFGFEAYEKTSNKALKKVMNHCENFLAKLDAMGISIKNIHIGENKVYQRTYNDTYGYMAKREIILRAPFDMQVLNTLMEEANRQDYEVEISTSYELSDTAAIHEELLKLAIADSRKKAELIAAAVQQKIVGIDSVNLGDMYHEYPPDICCDVVNDMREGSANSFDFSNQLSAGLREETESISVVWLIE